MFFSLNSSSLCGEIERFADGGDEVALLLVLAGKQRQGRDQQRFQLGDPIKVRVLGTGLFVGKSSFQNLRAGAFPFVGEALTTEKADEGTGFFLSGMTLSYAARPRPTGPVWATGRKKYSAEQEQEKEFAPVRVNSVAPQVQRKQSFSPSSFNVIEFFIYPLLRRSFNLLFIVLSMI